MTDVMTARTEHQVLVEVTRIFRDATATEQYDRVPALGVLRFDFARLTSILGAKFSRIIARRCNFMPDDGQMWWRGFARGEGSALLDLDSIESDLRLAVDDLDPLGLTTPYQRGRVEPS